MNDGMHKTQVAQIYAEIVKNCKKSENKNILTEVKQALIPSMLASIVLKNTW